MRRSSDLPADRPRARITGRGVLIALGALFLFILIFGRAIARFYVDFLWHDALDRGDVFWGVIAAKATLFFGFFAIFTLLAVINLVIADRAAPESFPANVHPYVERFHDVFGRRLRLVRYAVAVVFAFLLAVPAIGRWQEWLLFRNSQSFGVDDAQFGNDVGFYIFELPFLTFLLDWLFAALIIVLLLTIATHILNGGVVFVAPVPAIRSATKTHVAVLLAILAIAKAGDYWLDRYDLTNDQTGIVQGATYSVVNAQLPAIMLLILIALLTAALFFSVARTGSFRLPIIASGLWLVVSIVGGLIYPAIVQGLIVNPNQESREAEFIERNVNATRQAYGIEEVEVREIEFGTLTATEVESDIESINNVRLLNPADMRNRFIFDRGDEPGLTIDDLDVDRYVLPNTPNEDVEQTLVAALELDLSGVTNRTWQGLHLISTHGCGIVAAPASTVQANERPAYSTPEVERPELYFSPSIGGYAITNTDVREDGCDNVEDGDDEYEGTLGVRMNSFARRAAFALAFLEYNIIGSGDIDNDSQMLWVRGVEDRLEKLAPFLSYDADPYPVALDDRVVWVVDAYTTTTRYPYAESIGDIQLGDTGLSRSDNYVRNSVKAVVDAYTGDVTLYVIDDEPIIRAWRSAFPRSLHRLLGDARRTPRQSAVPRGPVPGADRSVLEVPDRRGRLLPAHGCVVGGAGSGPRARREPWRRAFGPVGVVEPVFNVHQQIGDAHAFEVAVGFARAEVTAGAGPDGEAGLGCAAGVDDGAVLGERAVGADVEGVEASDVIDVGVVDEEDGVADGLDDGAEVALSADVEEEAGVGESSVGFDSEGADDGVAAVADDEVVVVGDGEASR